MSTTVQMPAGTSAPRAEAPYTLDEAPPRTLGFLDQFSLWGNLGVSLTLPVLGPLLLPEGASLLSAVVAVEVGAFLGSLLLGLTAVPGAALGAPAMVVFRGLLGARLSYLPTALNVLQCVGWAVVEVVVIAEVATTVTSPSLRWLFIVLAGIAATALALFPLGYIKTLRKYAVALVLIASAYLFVQVLRHGIGSWTDGNWSGFWPAVDLVVGLAISWAPLAADYSRHSRSKAAAFGGAFGGYTVGGSSYLLLGVFAFASSARTATDITGALLVGSVAAVALAVLAIDEVDEAFANIYSTAISVQNVAPRADRRVLAVVMGAAATTVALVIGTDTLLRYETFLYLIGAVFVPLSAVLVVAFFATRGRGWNTAIDAPSRPWLLLPWVLGFAAYQLIYPTAVTTWWTERWAALQSALGFTPQAWMSASLLSFGVAAVVTLAVLPLARRR
ncbi:MAG: permease for cytosine/purines uracil thiamine allantoin [Frankiales bacterium]|nr:permease for cytosine/purines uracil thiamine allantoin [Frankiales bacterium]